VKQLDQLTVEEFRMFRNFTIDKMIDVLQLSVGKYESIKDKKVTYYAHCQEINNFLIEEVGKEIKEVFEKYKIEFADKKSKIVRIVIEMDDGQLDKMVNAMIKNSVVSLLIQNKKRQVN